MSRNMSTTEQLGAGTDAAAPYSKEVSL